MHPTATVLIGLTALALILGLAATAAVTLRRLTRMRADLADACWRADHDQLTGLANRYLLERVVGGWLADGRPVALALADLDNLHQLNNVLGHAGGDQILRHTADRLTQAAGPDGLVVRLGGDEFVLAWPGLTADDGYARTAQAHAHLVAEPVNLGSRHRIVAETSIGVAATTGSDGLSLPGLLRRADEAAAHAKQTRTAVVAWDDLLPAHTHPGFGRPRHRLRERRHEVCR